MEALKVISWPYRIGLKIDRFISKKTKLKRPVISVGNIAAGGRAKTPVVIDIVLELKKRKMTPVVLTRGYGRKRTEAVWLDPSSIVKELNAEDVGDEALETFMKTRSFVLVGADRVTNAQMFLNRFPKLPHVVFVLDDGFQHWNLERDVDVVLYSTYDLSDQLLPFGRLREEVSALDRADIKLKLSDDVKKISSFKEAPNNFEKTLVLTTRVADEKYLNFIRSKIPAFEHVALKDHAHVDRMLDVIEDYKPEQIVLGFKEAVKLCEWGEIETLLEKGSLHKRIRGNNCRIVVADCHLEFKDKDALCLALFEKLY